MDGLRKVYRHLRKGDTVAVDNLSFAVPAGGVAGFLGANGSGKTTTIRCLLGLVRPTSGRASLLGARSQHELGSVIRRVGSIVETPVFFPAFSGRRNLELLGRIDGIGRQSVDAVLERVGLAERARHAVKTYSLGMRQRLGIAAALLRDPEVLILDEPANGLDPAGMKEMRDLLRGFGAEGRTVFVSSHLLGEIQQVCDHVTILSRGKCIASGSVDEVLLAGRASALVVRLRPDELNRGVEALRAAGIAARLDDGTIRVELPATEGARVTETLAREGLYLGELRAEEISLEDVFLSLTGDEAV